MQPAQSEHDFQLPESCLGITHNEDHFDNPGDVIANDAELRAYEAPEQLISGFQQDIFTSSYRSIDDSKEHPF